jgi:predicted nucleotidyltransferase
MQIYYSKLGGERKRAILDKSKRILEDDERIVPAYSFGSFTRRSTVRDIDIVIYSHRQYY